MTTLWDQRRVGGQNWHSAKFLWIQMGGGRKGALYTLGVRGKTPSSAAISDGSEPNPDQFPLLHIRLDEGG